VRHTGRQLRDGARNEPRSCLRFAFGAQADVDTLIDARAEDKVSQGGRSSLRMTAKVLRRVGSFAGTGSLLELRPARIAAVILSSSPAWSPL
jgi:hypothetical protein